MESNGMKLSARNTFIIDPQGKVAQVFMKVNPSKPVEFTGMTIVRVQDGRLVEAWNNFDFMTMYRQIGLI